MGLLDNLRTITRTHTNARLLRTLLREQQHQTIALEAVAANLNGIGRLIAKMIGEPWVDKLPREFGSEADQSGLGMPDDQFFADLEAIQQDYERRFGRTPTEEEILAVLEDHAGVREGTIEP